MPTRARGAVRACAVVVVAVMVTTAHVSAAQLRDAPRLRARHGTPPHAATRGGATARATTAHPVQPNATAAAAGEEGVGTDMNVYFALQQLFEECSGYDWYDYTNWSKTDYCTYSGVKCDEFGSVIHLDLYSNNLACDQLPLGLAKIPTLQLLSLYSNAISGTLPAEVFANLTSLQVLNLRGNQIVGTIPDVIGDLAQLTELRLGWNRMSGTIPDSLGQLTQMQHLALENNAFVGLIPFSLSSLTELQYLSLTNNNLAGLIPYSLGALKKLETLDLSYNTLGSTVPDEIGQLTGLQLLSLSSNGLEGTLPSTLGNLLQLKTLTARYNKLSGAIPDVGALHGLQTLELDYNQFTEVPPTLLGLRPTSVMLNNNNFTSATLNSTMAGMLAGATTTCSVAQNYMDCAPPSWMPGTCVYKPQHKC